MQNGLRRSELELCGPGNDFQIGPRSSRGVNYWLLDALSPMAATRSAPGGRQAPKSKTVGSKLGDELDLKPPT
eukprot:11198250-Alexandrium_andersonii.AAC.1